MCTRVCAVVRVSVDTWEGGRKGEAGGGRRTRSSTLSSTVSSRIALLPANVCHVCAPLRSAANTTARVYRGACESAGAHARSRVHASPVALRARTEFTYSDERESAHTAHRTHDANSRASCEMRRVVPRVANKRVSQGEKTLEGQFPASEERRVGKPLAFILFREISICNFGI